MSGARKLKLGRNGGGEQSQRTGYNIFFGVWAKFRRNLVVVCIKKYSGVNESRKFACFFIFENTKKLTDIFVVLQKWRHI